MQAVLFLTAVGDLDRAFEVCDAYLLEQGSLMASTSWRKGEFSMNDQRARKTHMLFIPPAAPLRADPRFDVLMQRLGLERYWRGAGVTPTQKTV